MVEIYDQDGRRFQDPRLVLGIVRSREQITTDIDACLEPARARMAAASEETLATNPTETYWLTRAEAEHLNTLHLELMTHPENSRAAAQARVAQKRAARLRGEL